MDPDNAQHFSLNSASAVDKVYQRNILSRQIFLEKTTTKKLILKKISADDKTMANYLVGKKSR